MCHIVLVAITITVHGLHLEIFTLVSEIHGYVCHVFGIKYLFEIKGDLNSRKSDVTFLKRFMPMLFLKVHK